MTMRHRQTWFPERKAPLAFLLALVVFGIVQPVQSGEFGAPSNMAGIWKMEFQSGAHLVSFPLLGENATVESILADHFPPGAQYHEATRIITMGDEEYEAAWYNGASWEGTLEELDPRRGYWLILPDGSDPVVLTLVGESLGAESVEMGSVESGLNLVAAPMPHAITLAGSGLVTSGMVRSDAAAVADRISAFENGVFATAWATRTHGWQGQTFPLEPEKGYILWHAPGRDPFDWIVSHSSETSELDLSNDGPTPASTLMNSISMPVPDFTVPPWETGTDSKAVSSTRKHGVR